MVNATLRPIYPPPGETPVYTEMEVGWAPALVRMCFEMINYPPTGVRTEVPAARSLVAIPTMKPQPLFPSETVYIQRRLHSRGCS